MFDGSRLVILTEETQIRSKFLDRDQAIQNYRQQSQAFKWAERNL